MANPFDFTAGAVLTAAQLNQIGDFESFTPSWTNLTVGDATQQAKFAQVNEIVYFQVEFIAGSSSTFGSEARINLHCQLHQLLIYRIRRWGLDGAGLTEAISLCNS